jgi:glucokinase
MSAFAIGVDLGGTNLRIAAVDEHGTTLEKITTGTQLARGRDFVITEMCTAIRDLAARLKDATLLGIGIGVPGIIDMATGMLRESPNLPGWQDYPVRHEIEHRLGTRVILENDANAAAMGEKWLGAARDYDDMCMLTLGTGVGGGMVLRGRIWHGMTGMAGELGHITVAPDGPPCGCGSRGCVEQFASATAVGRMAREAIARGEAPELARVAETNPEFGAKIVYQLAMQGDRASQEIFRRVGWALGIVLADMVNVLNLPIYVIGGGVVNSWDAFAPAMMEEVRKRSFVYAATSPEDAPAAEKRTIITRALLGGDAGLYGAARLPMLTDEVARHELARESA